MTKANLKKWFPGYVARISFSKVDRWAEARKGFEPYFDTWAEAHQYMQAKASKRLEAAKRELKSATRHHAKVQEMQEPALGADQGEQP